MRELELGTVFAGHRIDELAGRGGMGVVYRAVQLTLSRTVALKVIAPDLMDDSAIGRRFLRESRMAASIEHPNVIPIHYVGEDHGIAYIAMRYVSGDDLRTLVRREGALDPARAARIVAQVGAALDAAHAVGLVHRDVKPANVLLAPGDHAYLTDFGLTTDLESSGASSTGRWVGTLDYVAPEQIRGEPVDARADVYSLGAVLYFTLTGRVPFTHEGQEAKLWAHLTQPPPSAAKSGAPEAFDPLIARAMAKDPAARYPSTGDLGRAAEAAVTGTPVTEAERTVASGSAAPRARGGATATETAITRAAPTDTPTRTAPVPAGTAGIREVSRRRSRRPLGAAAAAVLFAGAAVAFATGRDGGDPGRDRSMSSPSPAPAAPAARADTGRTTLRLVHDVAAPLRPSSVVLTPGRVWVGSFHSERLLRVSRTTGKRLRRAPPIGSGIRHLATGRGSLWVALRKQPHLVEADRRTGRPVRAPIPLPARASALVVDGNTLWVALVESFATPAATLARVDARTGEIRSTTPFAGGIDALEVARGSLWAVSADRSRLLEVDRESGAVRGRIRLRGLDPIDLEFGAGALWVTIYDDDSLVRVDPETGATASITVGVRPVGLAVHGNVVWVANYGSSTVTRVDARSGRVSAEIDVPLNPYAVVADADGAWVTTLGTSRVVRIED